MKFTKIDQELYDSFRASFPDFNIDNIDEEKMKVNFRSIFLSHTPNFYFENHWRFLKTDFTIEMIVGQMPEKSIKI